VFVVFFYQQICLCQAEKHADFEAMFDHNRGCGLSPLAAACLDEFIDPTL
jgi:hypothetical protein